MQVNLSWATVANALYYNIYRGTVAGGPYLQIGQSNPNPGQNPGSGTVVTTFQDGTPVNGQNYYYRVSTVTADGESAYSTPETAALAPSAPSAPATVAVVVT
jgi:hypothetical protein